MADYIDRGILLKKLYSEGKYFLHYGIPYFKVDDIKSMPSVDAVEVVRCRDCRFFYNPMKTERGICTYGRHIPGTKMSCSRFGTTINDYCSRGEKE